jgi:Type II CAAX prenyl endopeptidase Rce1-like
MTSTSPTESSGLSGEPKISHWRTALVLGIATGIGAILVIPYAVASTGVPLHKRGLPLGVVIVLSGMQSAILASLLAWVGLRLGAALGLDAPLVRAWAERRPFVRQTNWVIAASVGVVAALAIVALDLTLFRLLLAPADLDRIRSALAAHHPARWQGALACFYGGVGEEVQLRLFFMTAIAWCIAKVAHKKSLAVFLIANVVAALIFGVGHLPFAATVFGSLTVGLVSRTVVLNALAGVMFGELYRRYGLEHAMVAHFCGDVVLHVVIGG